MFTPSTPVADLDGSRTPSTSMAGQVHQLMLDAIMNGQLDERTGDPRPRMVCRAGCLADPGPGRHPAAERARTAGSCASAIHPAPLVRPGHRAPGSPRLGQSASSGAHCGGTDRDHRAAGSATSGQTRVPAARCRWARPVRGQLRLPPGTPGRHPELCPAPRRNRRRIRFRLAEPHLPHRPGMVTGMHTSIIAALDHGDLEPAHHAIVNWTHNLTQDHALAA